MKKTQRELQLDILRIMSCYLVILVHTAMEGWYSISPRTYTWTVLNFYDTLGRPSLPIFIMISGSLFLRKEKIDLKKLWVKNILHLAVIYIVWAVFYAIMNNGVKKAIADPKIVWETVFGPNPQYHLWYLRTLINLYAISPLLWLLVHSMNKKSFHYFLIIFFIFGLLKTTVYELPFIPGWLHEQINLFVEMDLVGFSAYFMLGYFLSLPEYTEMYSIKKLSIIYIITMLAAAFLNQLIAWVDNWPTQALYNNFSIPVAIEAICLFLIIRKKFAGFDLSPRKKKWFLMLSESTLFVYLVHMFVIQRLQIYFNLYTTNYNVLISVPLFALLVFCISAVAGMILERIPILNKIL